MNPMNETEAASARELVGEAVRFAVFAASLDEKFGQGRTRLDVADPTITVQSPEDLHRVAAMVLDRADAGERVEVSTNFEIGVDEIVAGSELTIEWQHETRTGRRYRCTVYVLLDT